MTTEQRLERLERANRWTRRIGVVGAAAIAIVFLIGQGKDEPTSSITAKTITTERLVVRPPGRPPGSDPSPADESRLEFGFGSFDSAVIRVYDRDGTVRFRLRNDPAAGAVIQVHDKRGQLRGTLGTYNSGDPALEFYDAKGDVRAWLTLTRDGDAVLRFRDSAQKVRTSLAESALAMKDLAGRLRVWVGVHSRSPKTASAVIYDDTGKPIWQALRD